jgi:hypothetical protein
VQPGDYSAQQLDETEYKKLTISSHKIAISRLSMNIQEEIQVSCRDFINKSLKNLGDYLGELSQDKMEKKKDFLVFNPTLYKRKDIVLIQTKTDTSSHLVLIDEFGDKISFSCQNSSIKFIPEVPSLGYKVFSLVKEENEEKPLKGEFHYSLEILDDSQMIEITFKNEKVYELKFEAAKNYKLILKEQIFDNIEKKHIIKIEIDNKFCTLEIVQFNGLNQLEFILDADLLKKTILTPCFQIQKSLVNYPFGIEETRRTHIQALDFLWLMGNTKGIVFIQKNSQKFVINRENFEIFNLLNNKGRYEFCISIINEENFNTIYQEVYRYKFKLRGTEIQGHNEYLKMSDSMMSIDPIVSLINLWCRDGEKYFRIINSSKERKKIKIAGSLIEDQIHEVNFNQNIVKKLENNETIIDAWKIHNFKI